MASQFLSLAFIKCALIKANVSWKSSFLITFETFQQAFPSILTHVLIFAEAKYDHRMSTMRLTFQFLLKQRRKLRQQQQQHEHM